MYKTFFCLFTLLVVSRTVFAQPVRGQLVWTVKEVKMAIAYQIEGIKFSSFNQLPNFNPKLIETYPTRFQPQFITALSTRPSFFSICQSALPLGFDHLKLGWACRQEWKLEKATNIPIRLRLGSLEQVDYLEGKKNHLH